MRRWDRAGEVRRVGSLLRSPYVVAEQRNVDPADDVVVEEGELVAALDGRGRFTTVAWFA
ncbi:MAG: hypothetical protein H0W25_12040 [Acidimicrobiia bacterium]|nr:hypothetical protein [Acidimicrobiia bacterium]